MLHFTLFQNKSQLDVTSLLMLIGEATIWRAIWTRMRGRRVHWSHYIFTVSPGWTTLAGLLFASMDGGARPQNFIFDKVPEGCSDRKLMLTNLNSGATHSADQTILQNIYSTWVQGLPKSRGPSEDAPVDFTRQVGVMDLDLDRLTMTKRWAIGVQAVCLCLQIVAGIAFCAADMSAEVLIVLLVSLFGQTLLIISITPRGSAWQKVVRGHRGSPVMLHKGLDSDRVLIINRATLQGREISLEEFCWSSNISTDATDRLKAVGAGIAFVALVISVLMIGWMGPQGKLLYLIIGSVGLIANMLDAAAQPAWSSQLGHAFIGATQCAPWKCCLLGGVGVLIAGQFSGATVAAKMLYPDNARFHDTLFELQQQFDQTLCVNCRRVIKLGHSVREAHPCAAHTSADRQQDSCGSVLARKARIQSHKQLSDALATVSYLLISLGGADMKHVETESKIRTSPKHKYW